MNTSGFVSVTAFAMLALGGLSVVSAQVYPIVDPRDAQPTWIPPRPKSDYDKTNAYALVNLAATKDQYKPQFMVDPLLTNAWGLTLRPPGKGGHWWVTNAGTGTTTTYVGDAPGVPFGQDELKVVTIPVGDLHKRNETFSQPTGQVYTGFTSTDFIVEAEGVKGASKFLFAALDGTISGWTTGQTKSVTMVDLGAQNRIYTGLAVTDKPTGNLLYAVDFNMQTIDVFDGNFKPVKVSGNWQDPNNKDRTLAIYNMQYLDGKLYAIWARPANDPAEAENFTGYGFVSEFDTQGNHLRSFEHRQELIAPWGVAIAPKKDFGPLSGHLLVGNFGDGRILAYDLKTTKFVDYVRAPGGDPIEIDGLWGMVFGNGETLGYLNHLYFAAGPDIEQEGVFGKLVPLFP
jgi:uncharacterized protein (TIGR03118 family)